MRISAKHLLSWDFFMQARVMPPTKQIKVTFGNLFEQLRNDRFPRSFHLTDSAP